MSLKLLLADNSDLLKNVLELSLSEQNIELVFVPNGTEVLMQLKEINPDILLADVELPGVDGYSICEVIKKDPDLKSTKVFLIHEGQTPLDEAKAQYSGFDGSLTKPFNVEALFALLTSHGIELEETNLEPDGNGENDLFQVEDVNVDLGEMPFTVDLDVKDDASFADISASAPAVDEENDVVPDSVPEDLPEDSEIADSGIVDLTVDFSGSGISEAAEIDSSDVAVSKQDLDLGSIEISDVDELEVISTPGEILLTDTMVEQQTEQPFATEDSAEPTERSILTADMIQDVADLTPDSVEETPEESFDMMAETEAITGEAKADMASDQGKELIEEIVKKLSDDVVREVAWEVVPELAERMIKEALDKITK